MAFPANTPSKTHTHTRLQVDSILKRGKESPLEYLYDEVLNFKVNEIDRDKPRTGEDVAYID